MLRYFIALCVATLLGGCIVLPVDYDDRAGRHYGHRHHGWGDRHYGHDHGYWRYRDRR